MIEKDTKFKYKDKEYYITREQSINALIWPFNYKTKLSTSNKYIINAAFTRTMWEKPGQKKSFDRICQKVLGEVLSAEPANFKKNIKLVEDLSDDSLILFLNRICSIAFTRRKKSTNKEIWVMLKATEAYIQLHKLSKDFENIK